MGHITCIHMFDSYVNVTQIASVHVGLVILVRYSDIQHFIL